MLKKLMFASVLCAAFAMGATSAQAVTIDLSSPQEGAILHPGDAVEVTVTVTKILQTAAGRMIFARLD